MAVAAVINDARSTDLEQYSWLGCSVYYDFLEVVTEELVLSHSPLMSRLFVTGAPG